MATRVQWLGHACLFMETDGQRVLIDPFLTGNPAAATTADKVQADFILVSHGHGDHVGDTIPIAQRTGATVICNYEMSEWFAKKGVKKVHGQQHGGGHAFPFGRVKLTLAFHGSAFEYARNAAFDARRFTDTGALPPFQFNQFGGSVGGAILKNRTFFFANIEFYRVTKIASGTYQTVPTLAMRNGDFSAVLTGKQLTSGGRPAVRREGGVEVGGQRRVIRPRCPCRAPASPGGARGARRRGRRGIRRSSRAKAAGETICRNATVSKRPCRSVCRLHRGW